MSRVDWKTLSVITGILFPTLGTMGYLVERADYQHSVVLAKIDENRNILDQDIKNILKEQAQQALLLDQKLARNAERAADTVKPQIENLQRSLEFQERKTREIDNELEQVESKFQSVDEKAEEINSSLKEVEETVEQLIVPAILPKN